MAYNPPGVSVTEYLNPVVSPLLATADSLCLVGPVPNGGITKTDAVTFTSPELLSQGTWTTTAGWSGSANIYTHTTGTTTLTHSFAPTATRYYQIQYTVTGASGDADDNIAAGGIKFGNTNVNAAAITTSSVTETKIVQATNTNGLTITPGSAFSGTVTLTSIKQVDIPVVLPSIPSGGRLSSIDKVSLASNGQFSTDSYTTTPGTRFDKFKESGVNLVNAGTTFTVPANNNPWAIGQTVAAGSGIQSGTKVTGVASNTDGITLTITITPAINASVPSATLFVNQTTAGVSTQYVSVTDAPVSTVLSTAITTDSVPTTIVLSSTTGFPAAGVVQIDNELFTYTGVSSNTLTGVQIAQFGTTRAAHSTNAVVSLVTNTIARFNTTTSIELEDTILVTYTYVPSSYFEIIELDTMSDVEDRFGSVYNANGTINCKLSFAAQIAFENGADSVFLQPLFQFDTDGVTRKQPTNVGDAKPWDDTFIGLRSVDNINFIVPVIGQGDTLSTSTPGTPASTTQVKAVHAKLKDHLVAMVTDSGQYIIGIVGHNGTTSGDTTLTPASLIANVNDLKINHQDQGYDQQMVFVSSTKLQRPVSTSSANVALQVGGQYAAVAIGAMAASRQVAVSLTRKGLGGFSALLNNFTKKEKNAMAEAGILVIEQVGTIIQVRHAVTTETKNGVSQSELSVVRAKHFMMATLRDTVDTQVIGKVVADGNAPLVVSTAISSALETLKNNGDIVDFSDVQARTLPTGPTTVDVRFNYRPAFPVNYINIGFSIDLTSGSTTLSENNLLQAG